MPKRHTAYPLVLAVLVASCGPAEQPGIYEVDSPVADYGSATAVDVSPSAGYASDAWLDDGSGTWADEVSRRDATLRAYLGDTAVARAGQYGFRDGHTPALAWAWFEQHPIGYGGMPYVLLQTLLSLDPATETDPHLLTLANVWRRPSQVSDEQGQNLFTTDHLGFGPNPADYLDGVARAPAERNHRLPNGFVFDPQVQPEGVAAVDLRLRVMRDGIVGGLIRRISDGYTPKVARLLVLARGKIRRELYSGEFDYETQYGQFQEPPETDAVFFSCTGCHLGRVLVGGRLDESGNIVEPGRMKFLPGMPSTEAEPAAFSRALMGTGLALIESGFSIDAVGLPTDPSEVVPSTPAILALYTRMLSRVIDPEIVKTIYGSSPEDIRRAKIQTYRVAKDFPTYIGGVIATAMKTQYLYYQVGQTIAFNPDNPRRSDPDQHVPDVLSGHTGQMDAFGAAAGLVAIHTLRQDNSYLRFTYQENPANPLFEGFETIEGFEGHVSVEDAGLRIRSTLQNWAPPVPAPIDIPGVSWTAHVSLANWDGNQGASARALSSGTSATGDPRKVNVRIHEPLNPLMANLPPTPYPFPVDLERARRGRAIFEGQGLAQGETCSGCHIPNNTTIYAAHQLGVDENRSMVTTDVARYGLASVVMEACRLFIRKNPGNEWCLPKDENGEVVADWAVATDEYFKDTPARVRSGTNGYKASMLHGTWAQAPYLHNGSVPTLAHLICPAARPEKFKRGVLFYDQTMVGFEWEHAPRQRYSPHETQWVTDYDTREFSRDNSGHAYGTTLCPDLSGLDPVTDRIEIADRITASAVGDLLEYLKTF